MTNSLADRASPTDLPAVVIGASITGLCAARALRGRFARVVVIERDALDTTLAHRKGIPQSRHPHALLDRGRRELEALFPGFESTMLSRGALDLDAGWDFAMLQVEGWTPRSSGAMKLLFASRMLTESVVRELALAGGGIELATGLDTVGLVGDGRGGVAGVRVRELATGCERDVEAALVVDASGSESSAPDWLRAFSVEPPLEDTVDASAGYSTRWYEAPPASAWPADWWWKCMWIQPLLTGATRREEEYFGVLFPIEEGRWIVTVASWGGNPLPRDPGEFDALLQKLRSPALAAAVRLAKPISPVYHRKSMFNRRRRYDAWKARVPHFLAAGDAACSFNPVYGQGMSSAAACGGVLRRALERWDPLDPDFPQRFHRLQARFLAQPWSIATARDAEHGHAGADDVDTRSGAAEAIGRWLKRYMNQYRYAASLDPWLADLAIRVLNLTSSPAALVADPRAPLRVLVARVRQGFGVPAVLTQYAGCDWPPGVTTRPGGP